jgi:hypothetical protein
MTPKANMPIRSKKYFRKIKIIKHKKEGKEIEVHL